MDIARPWLPCNVVMYWKLVQFKVIRILPDRIIFCRLFRGCQHIVQFDGVEAHVSESLGIRQCVNMMLVYVSWPMKGLDLCTERISLIHSEIIDSSQRTIQIPEDMPGPKRDKRHDNRRF